MRLATLRTSTGSETVRIDGAFAVLIPGTPDVGALLRDPAWHERAAAADGPGRLVDEIPAALWAPVVPAPEKIVCVGLNYRSHILEMGRELPEYPTLFAKYPDALIGPYDELELPATAADAVDWEAELAVVIGADVRHADEDVAARAIAGYSVLNDVTMRNFQYRSPEWFQGKTFAQTAPFGPVLVTVDEFSLGGMLCGSVDGELVQQAPTDDLVFSPAALVSYISQIFPLRPGDVIATGTPGGVGHARTPKRYLEPGQVLTTSVDGIGHTRNRVVSSR
jgi:acylpyruvate hydrolase